MTKSISQNLASISNYQKQKQNLAFKAQEAPVQKRNEAGPIVTGAVVGGMFGVTPYLPLFNKSLRETALKGLPISFTKTKLAVSIAGITAGTMALGAIGGAIVKYAYRALHKNEK